jgi:hypothetical protein
LLRSASSLEALEGQEAGFSVTALLLRGALSFAGPQTFAKLGLLQGKSASAVLPALQAHRAKGVPLAEKSPPKRALGPDLSSWIQRAIAV